MKFSLLVPLILISCISKPENDNIESTAPHSNISSEEDTSFRTKSYSTITDDKGVLLRVFDGQDEYGLTCGYVNKNGDTIMPVGTFDMCFTDTFETFAYVSDKELYGQGTVAINRNKEVIFDAYIFENGQDYLSEGLFRMKRNGKIGYANERGEVVIEAKYMCAFPFENGKAKVAFECETIKDDPEHSSWVSSNWFYIDKTGSRIEK